ncbi:MAG: hypothetical protein LBU94_02765, partial [Clostridiales bacterium]|nr:hypothetical protein [Clostridiales bacterium]
MKSVKLESLFDINFLSEVKISPDGKHIAFVQSKGSVEENKYFSHIWLYSFVDSSVKELTATGTERSFIWLDNENIAFANARTDKERDMAQKGMPYTTFYKININGGEALKLFTIPLKAAELTKLDNGEFLFSSVYDNYGPDFLNMDDSEKEKAVKKAAEDNASFKIVDEIPFWQNGQGVTNKKRKRLYIFNPETKDVKVISDALLNVGTMSVSGNLIAFAGVEFENKMVQVAKVFVHDITKGETKYIDLGDEYNVHNVELFGDKIMFIGVRTSESNSYRNPEMFFVQLSGGKAEPFVNLDQSFGGGIGSDCKYGGGQTFVTQKDYFYYISARGASSFLFKLCQKGNETMLSPGVTGSVDAFDIKGDVCAYIAVRDKGLQELYTLDLSTGTEKRLTFLNADWLKEHSVSYPEYFTMINRDGTELDCWIIKPVGYDPNKKYPAILDMHGGPKAIYGDSLFHEMQVWDNEGYFVFFTNPRGSDGKGSEFANIIGDRYL